MWPLQAGQLGHAKEGYLHATTAIDNRTQDVPVALNNFCAA
jgi:hypothetical protein